MSKFMKLLEDVALTTESDRAELADLLAEEMDDAANTFDNFVTPEADVAPTTEDPDDDAVISQIGSEVAADAIDGIGNVSEDDGLKFDTQIVDDETGEDITNDIKAGVDEAEASADGEVSDSDAIDFDGDGDNETDLGAGDADDDVDDAAGDGDPEDGPADISEDEMKDIDPDDLLGGAFSDEDELIMDDSATEIGDLVDAAEDELTGESADPDVDGLADALLEEAEDEPDEVDAAMESLLSEVEGTDDSPLG